MGNCVTDPRRAAPEMRERAFKREDQGNCRDDEDQFCVHERFYPFSEPLDTGILQICVVCSFMPVEERGIKLLHLAFEEDFSGLGENQSLCILRYFMILDLSSRVLPKTEIEARRQPLRSAV